MEVLYFIIYALTLNNKYQGSTMFDGDMNF